MGFLISNTSFRYIASTLGSHTANPLYRQALFADAMTCR